MSTQRSRTSRGQATRLRILHAAADLIHLHGVSGTSVEDILDAADAGKGQFYHYFGSKEELVRNVLELQSERTTDMLSPHLEGGGWEGIRRWLDAVLEFQRSRGWAGGCPVGSMAAETADRDPELRPALVAAFAAKRIPLAGALVRLQRQGELDADADPEELAAFVLATLQGGQLLAATVREGTPLEAAARHAWLHLRSFAPEGPSGGKVDPRQMFP